MTVDERSAVHAREWSVSIDEIRTTETSQLGFGTRKSQPVVLKVIRKENSEEWRSGEVLAAFGGALILPIASAPGAVLMPRLVPGYDLASICLAGRDDEATEIIASVVHRMPALDVDPAGWGSVERMQPDFAKYHDAGEGWIPHDFVDRAESLFVELCRTQRNVRLLHGDLHQYNVLFDTTAGWVAIDPQGPMGEIEFEVGASLRNPAMDLLGSPRTLERRLRTYEDRLQLDAQRALMWAFATTVLGILWPFEQGVGLDLRAPFALAARSMHELL